MFSSGNINVADTILLRFINICLPSHQIAFRKTNVFFFCSVVPIKHNSFVNSLTGVPTTNSLISMANSKYQGDIQALANDINTAMDPLIMEEVKNVEVPTMYQLTANGGSPPIH